MYALCQVIEVTYGRGVGTRDISRWIQKSKPTVIRYMWNLELSGLVSREIEEWRPNVNTYRYYPSPHVIELWKEGAFTKSWRVHEDEVLKPLKTRKR